MCIYIVTDRASPKIHCDDTTIPVLQKEKTHRGRLWVYVGGGGTAPPSVVYRYTRTRAGKEPLEFLANYHGFLQADAYAGFDKCYASGKIIEVACMAHARRKFTEVIKSNKKSGVAQSAIDYFSKLYAIEDTSKFMSDNQRYFYRKNRSKPILKKFYKWLIKHKKVLPPKSPVGDAINYCLNHWKALTNYLRNGVLSIDNNIAERMMRAIALGRKNYLFAGSDLGAEHAAIIYSIIETCKLLNINTIDYLKDVLERLPNTLNSELYTLVPYHWKAAD